MHMSGPRPQGINIGFKRMPGPRPQKPVGTIDVIGAPSQNPIRAPAPRENVIQVMTADRREYSRTVVNQSQMPLQFNVPPEDFYNHEEQDAFNYGYEPTQDSQGWNSNQGWTPSDIKELTPMNQPPPNMGGPPPGMNLNIPPPHMQGGPRMPMMGIPPLMSGGQPMSSMNMNPNVKMEDDKRDMRRMGGSGYGRDMRDDRKRRERSSSRDRDRFRTETRDKYRNERSRDSARPSDRRRSKSRDRKRSRSRDRSRRSRSKDRKDDKSRRNDDKSRRTSVKKEEV